MDYNLFISNSEKKDRIKFILKGFIFIILIFVLSVLIESQLNRGFLEMNQLEEALKTDNAKIIYFGDSVVKFSSRHDQDKRSINELLKDKVKIEVVGIIHEAYHLGVYEAFSENICASEHKKPEFVIIPINLRSFSQEWDTRPNYQFDNEIKLLKKHGTLTSLWTRVCSLFEIQENQISKWKNQTVYYNGIPRGKIKDYLIPEPTTEKEKSDYYIFHYLYELDENHRRIESLKKIIKNFDECGVKLLLYITPINYQLGESYLGDNFSKIIKENVNIIENAIDNTKVRYTNLTFSLNKEYFASSDIPDEHLTDQGRKFIADKLYELLQKNSNHGYTIE